MRLTQWLGVAAAIALAVCCFFPWVTIPERNIVISGIAAKGTTYGRPGYLHFIFIAVYLFFVLLNKVLAQRINIFVAALNLGWAIRNFIILPSCQAGECPQKETGLYLALFFSITMLVIAFFGSNQVVENNAPHETR